GSADPGRKRSGSADMSPPPQQPSTPQPSPSTQTSTQPERSASLPMLGVLALSEMLCMTLWFTASAGVCTPAMKMAATWFRSARGLAIAVPLTLVWGFFVVADSAQLSAMVTELAPPRAVGTALTQQTSAGFLLTLTTIQAIPWLQETVGWRWAFPILAIGPFLGIAAIGLLERESESPAGEG
ncbi:MAG: hypothetical protein AAF725_25430, partial [Acidobacteriota bacterium]